MGLKFLGILGAEFKLWRDLVPIYRHEHKQDQQLKILDGSEVGGFQLPDARNLAVF